MEQTLKAIEMTGTVDEQQHLQLDSALPIAGPIRVKVILLYPLSEDTDEAEWLHAAAKNPAFEYLKDSVEDIYSPTEGTAFHDQV